MHRYDPARRKLALGLAFLAGTVDATGFIRTGGYFASFMSGNTTRLGLHIAGQPSIAYIPFALICGFVTGVVLGSLPCYRRGDAPPYRRSDDRCVGCSLPRTVSLDLMFGTR